jgi:N4-gp56 family major capsid protein
MKETIRELAQSQASDVQGTTVGTKYGLQPIQYLKDIVDAAKNQLFFTNFINQVTAPVGVHDVVVPRRTQYEGRSGMSFDTSERQSADITWTTMDTLASTIITPTPVLAGYAITNYAIKTNSVNLLQAAKDELSYAIGDRVDRLVATTIGDATSTTSTTTGAVTLYGGDATSDNTLATGDIITTDLVAQASRQLKTQNKQYRANTGAGGGYGAINAATVTGNPWSNTPDDPFVLFIGPAQEEAFRKDSQFVNAAEYGGNEIVRNGEIGQYLGIKIVVTNNVEQVAAGAEGPDAETANAGTRMTRCILMKGKKACTLAWGQKPTLKVFDYPNRDQTRISLVCAYAASVIHADAIVFIDVADA